MAEFPKGPGALAKAGYIYLKDGVCKDAECGAIIHWYKFAHTGQVMPIDSITMEPHWKCCPGAARFRKKKPKPAPPPQLNMFEKPMREPGED